MAKLEAEAGTTLLSREGAGVQLTEAGRLLHEHALGIVEAVRRAHAGLDALQAEQVKRLRIAACPVATAAVVPRALRVLRRRLPGAELLLEETTATDALRDGRADVGVWISSGGGPEFDETVLARGPLLVALPSDHSLTRLHELDDEALAATPRIFGAVGLAARLALVAAGEGYDLLPALAARSCPRVWRCGRSPALRSGSCGPAGPLTPCRRWERWPRSRRCVARPSVSVAQRLRQQCLSRTPDAGARIAALELLELRRSPGCRPGGPPNAVRVLRLNVDHALEEGREAGELLGRVVVEDRL
jgi:hypothetical protein